MPIDKLVEQARAALQKAPVDHWEVFANAGESLTVGIRDGQVDKFQASQSVAAAFRVLVGGRMGFSYLHGQGEQAVKAAVEQAVQAAAAADPIPELSLPGPAGDLPEVEVFDPAVLAESEEEKIDRAKRLAAAAQQADPRVVKVQPAQVAGGHGRARLVNSRGLDVSQKATNVGAMVAVMASENGQQEQGYEGKSVRFLADLDVEEVGRTASQRATGALGGAPVPDGRYDVVLENGIVADFLGILAPSFTGDNVYKGRSLLADRMGDKVVSQVLTLVDDPFYPKGPGTSPFDGEGTPTSVTPLLEQGKLANFVYDRLYGKLCGKASTGNSSRPGVGGPPGVGFSNLVLRPGEKTLDELLATMGEGLMITEIMGGHTANPVSGEFSFGASGYLISGGKIARPVKSIAIAGQVLDFLSAATAVGGDLRFFGKTGCPSLLVEKVSVSGPEATSHKA